MLKDQTVYSPSDLYASSSRSFVGKGASSPQAENSDSIAKAATIATTIKMDFFIIFPPSLLYNEKIDFSRGNFAMLRKDNENR